MDKRNPEVDTFFQNARRWQEEMKALRTLILQCNLHEELKWMHPCYTWEQKNIVLIHGFKEYCAILFFKGVLLHDSYGILVQQTENVQDRRQIRFTSLAEVAQWKGAITAYVNEAILLEKAGVKTTLKTTAEFAMANEFKKCLAADGELKAAFERLTPGRQRGYLLHFSAPKQSKTRENRIAKATPAIMAGKGLND